MKDNYSLDSLIASVDYISNRCVVKQTLLAEKYDDPTYVSAFNRAKAAYFKSDDLDDYTIVYDDLAFTTLTPTQKLECLDDKQKLYEYLSEAELATLLNNKRTERVDSYEEQNIYYRMLQGLPNGDTDIVYIEEDVDGIDTSKPVHEFSEVEVEILKINGLLDKIINENPKFKYLTYLDRRITSFISRPARTFSLIYVDGLESSTLVNIFSERWEVTRRRFLASIYNEFYYSYQSMYEDMMIVYLLGVTYIDTVIIASDTDDINDTDTLSKFYLSEGVPDWNLPKGLKVNIAKSLNTFIRERASKKVILDICDVFNVDNVFRYVIHKRLALPDFDETTPESEKYDMNFFRVPFEDPDVYNYIQDTGEGIPFDVFVADDPRWGIGDDNLREHFENMKFSFIDTKYISIENMIDVSKIALEISLFFNYVFENDKKLLQVKGRYTNTKSDVSISNALVYIMSLISLKYAYSDTIFKDLEAIYYVIGMNTEQDLTEVDLWFRTEWTGNDYETMISDMQKLPAGCIPAPFMATYDNNRRRILDIMDAMGGTDDIREYRMAKQAYEAVSLMKVVNEMFEGVDTYTEYIEKNDFPLFQRHSFLKKSAEDVIDQEINEIIEFIKDLLNPNNLESYEESLGFLDSIDRSRFNDMKKYLFMILNYFKSYTIDLKDMTTTFVVDHPLYSGRLIDEVEVNEHTSDWEGNYNHDDVDTETDLIYETSQKSISAVTIIDHEEGVIDYVKS